jgi:AbrB family looped-hinge helix DNA binding protein
MDKTTDISIPASQTYSKTYRARVSSQGQITLPKELRQRTNIKKGESYIYVSLIDSNTIAVQPGPSLEQLYGALPVASDDLSAADIVADIRANESRRY